MIHLSRHLLLIFTLFHLLTLIYANNQLINNLFDLTTSPTIEPTINPTNEPTINPTNEPTNEPTINPTNEPTNPIPTNKPTSSPTSTGIWVKSTMINNQTAVATDGSLIAITNGGQFGKREDIYVGFINGGIFNPGSFFLASYMVTRNQDDYLKDSDYITFIGDLITSPNSNYFSTVGCYPLTTKGLYCLIGTYDVGILYSYYGYYSTGRYIDSIESSPLANYEIGAIWSDFAVQIDKKSGYYMYAVGGTLGVWMITLDVTSSSLFEFDLLYHGDFRSIAVNYNSTVIAVGSTLGHLLIYSTIKSSGYRLNSPYGCYYDIAIDYTGRYITIVLYNDNVYVSSDYGSSFLSTNLYSYSIGISTSVSMTKNGQYQAVSTVNSDIYTSTNYGITFTSSKAGSLSWLGVLTDAYGKYLIGYGLDGIYGQTYSVDFINYPTNEPTNSPTDEITFEPTDIPTTKPSCNPTYLPTIKPTNSPTNQPTISPSNQPTIYPTKQPTIYPTIQPSSFPTNHPITDIPTNYPTVQPTNRPTKQIYDSMIMISTISLLNLPSDINSNSRLTVEYAVSRSIGLNPTSVSIVNITTNHTYNIIITLKISILLDSYYSIYSNNQLVLYQLLSTNLNNAIYSNAFHEYITFSSTSIYPTNQLSNLQVYSLSTSYEGSYNKKKESNKISNGGIAVAVIFSILGFILMILIIYYTCNNYHNITKYQPKQYFDYNNNNVIDKNNNNNFYRNDNNANNNINNNTTTDNNNKLLVADQTVDNIELQDIYM